MVNGAPVFLKQMQIGIMDTQRDGTHVIRLDKEIVHGFPMDVIFTLEDLCIGRDRKDDKVSQSEHYTEARKYVTRDPRPIQAIQITSKNRDSVRGFLYEREMKHAWRDGGGYVPDTILIPNGRENLSYSQIQKLPENPITADWLIPPIGYYLVYYGPHSIGLITPEQFNEKYTPYTEK